MSAQAFPHSLKDVRLGSIRWIPQEGKFGPYESITRDASNEWLFLIVEQVKDERGYAYDQDGIYRYKVSTQGNWMNRYKKSKADWAMQAQGQSQIQQQPQQRVWIPPMDQQQPVTAAAATETPVYQPREPPAKSDMQRGHEENMESDEKTRNAIEELTKAILVLASEIAKKRANPAEDYMAQEALTRRVEELRENKEELQHKRFGE